jgi:hypothetical protein
MNQDSERNPFRRGAPSTDHDDDAPTRAPFRRSEGMNFSRNTESDEEKVGQFEKELQIGLPPIPEVPFVEFEAIASLDQLIALVAHVQPLLNFQRWKHEPQRLSFGRGTSVPDSDPEEITLVGLDAALESLRQAKVWLDHKKQPPKPVSTNPFARLREGLPSVQPDPPKAVDLSQVEQLLVVRAIELNTYKEALEAQQRTFTESWLAPFLNTTGPTDDDKEASAERPSPFGRPASQEQSRSGPIRFGSSAKRSESLSLEKNASYEDVQEVVASLKSVPLPEIPLFPPFSNELEGFDSLQSIVDYWTTFHEFMAMSESYDQSKLNSLLGSCRQLAGEILDLTHLSKEERNTLQESLDERYSNIVRAHQRMIEVKALFDQTWVAKLQDTYNQAQPITPATSRSSRNPFGRKKPESQITKFADKARETLRRMSLFGREEAPSEAETDDDEEDYDEDESNEGYDADEYVKSLNNIELAHLLCEHIEAVLAQEDVPKLPKSIDINLEKLTLPEIEKTKYRAEDWRELAHWAQTGSLGIIAKLHSFRNALEMYNRFGLVDADRYAEAVSKINEKIDAVQQIQEKINEQLSIVEDSPELSFLLLEDEDALKLMLVQQAARARTNEALLNQLLSQNQI